MQSIWINARFLDRPVTGVERVARELLGALARDCVDARGCLPNGTRIMLIAPTGGTAPSPWPNLELIRAGHFGGHLWEQLELPRLTRAEPLISLCNTGPAFKRQHLIFMHDAQTFAIPGAFSASFGLWYRTLFRIAGRCARGVLVNSRFTRGELARHAGIEPERMHLIRFGVDHARRCRPASLLDLDLPEEPWLLAFASANPNKNFTAVLRALELLGEAAPPCVVVGACDERIFGTDAASPRGIHRVGRIDDGQLRSLYLGALALVFPSHYEGFGLPPLEAMANGCPAIVASTGALPEIVGDAALFCDPQHPMTLARSIHSLITDPQLADQCLERGLAHCRDYSWSTGARDLLRACARAFYTETTLVPSIPNEHGAQVQ